MTKKGQHINFSVKVDSSKICVCTITVDVEKYLEEALIIIEHGQKSNRDRITCSLSQKFGLEAMYKRLRDYRMLQEFMYENRMKNSVRWDPSIYYLTYVSSEEDNLVNINNFLDKIRLKFRDTDLKDLCYLASQIQCNTVPNDIREKYNIV